MLLVNADANGDGQLQLEEAMSVLSREHADISEEEAQEVKETFADADNDASSGLNKEELADAVKKWYHGGGGGFYFHRGPFGGVSAGGFRVHRRGWGYLMEMGQPEKDEKGGAEMLLVKADANGDGQLQLEEAMSLLSREHADISEEEAQEVEETFADADKDASAGLNKEELADAVKKWYRGGGGGFYVHRGPFGGVSAGGFRVHRRGWGYLMEMGQPEKDEMGQPEMLLVNADANGD